MSNLFCLAGKNAVITGGGSGIGLEMAKIFAQRGAKVFIADLNEQSALRAADIVNGLPEVRVSAVGIVCNVTDEKSVQTCFAKIHSVVSRVDILCNNAGIGHVGNVLNCEESDMNRVMAVNVNGILFCSKEAIKSMVNLIIYI